MKETFTDIHIQIMEKQLEAWYEMRDHAGDLLLMEEATKQDEEYRREKIRYLYENADAYYQMVLWHIEDLKEKMEARRANN